VLSAEIIKEAQADKTTRKKVLAKYRKNKVDPALRVLDESAFDEAAGRSVWPYASFQHQLSEYPQELLEVNWGPNTWYYYRAWAVVRATGRIPLRVFGGIGLPRSCEPCVLCGATSVDIEHLLTHCPATYALYAKWWSSMGRSGLPSARLDWPMLRMELFAGRLGFLTSSSDEGAVRILYVGAACKQLVDAQRSLQLDQEVSQLLVSAESVAKAEVCLRGGP
jgi:hypothetical protein